MCSCMPLAEPGELLIQGTTAAGTRAHRGQSTNRNICSWPDFMTVHLLVMQTALATSGVKKCPSNHETPM
jgi:hypothetical protein